MGGRNGDAADRTGGQAVQVDDGRRDVVLQRSQAAAGGVLREEANLVGHHLREKPSAGVAAVSDDHVVAAHGDGGRQDAGDLVHAALVIEVDQVRVGARAARDRREGDLYAAGKSRTRRRERCVPAGRKVGALDDKNAALGDVRRVAGRILHGGDGGRGSSSAAATRVYRALAAKGIGISFGGTRSRATARQRWETSRIPSEAAGATREGRRTLDRKSTRLN